MITCRELADFLYEYVAGEMPEAARRDFDAHLALCPNCLHYLRNYEMTIRAGRMAFEEQPPPLPEDLIRAILAARREKDR